MEHKKRSKGSVWEFCYANKIFGTFGFKIKACGQELVKFCAHTHTTAAKLVVRIADQYTFIFLCFRLLGKWEEAASDLSTACKLDYDDTANEMLKEVAPKVCHKVTLPPNNAMAVSKLKTTSVRHKIILFALFATQ